MPRQFIRMRASQVKRGVNGRKNLGDPEKAKALALSRIAHQIHPLIATTDRILIDGYRTLWGLELLNRLDAELDFVLTDEELSPPQIALIQGVSAIHREDWPLADKCEWVIELTKTMPGKDIASELGVTPAMVSHWRSFERLIPEAREVVREGKMGLRDMTAIAALPPDDQPALLAIKLKGASAEELERASRSRRNSSLSGSTQNASPAARLPRIKIPLANDAATGVVTVAGESIDLDDAENLLKEALKSVRAAKEKNLDCRTAQAVWRDVAKAGA
jgi:hypothetical protein